MKSIRLCCWQPLVMAFLVMLPAPWATARKQKPATATNTTFTSCNTGTSRIIMANLDKLPQECHPSHHHVAAAIYSCFEGCRVKVENCQVTMHPSKKKAKESPICKVVYARGQLQGVSNASLVAVIDPVRYNKLVEDDPKMLSGISAASFHKSVAETLAQLFGRTVVPELGKCAAAKAAKADRGSKGKHSSVGDSSQTGAAGGAVTSQNSTTSAGTPALPPGGRRSPSPIVSEPAAGAANTTASTAPLPTSPTVAGSATAVNATAGSSGSNNASVPGQPAGAAANSSIINSTNTTVAPATIDGPNTITVVVSNISTGSSAANATVPAAAAATNTSGHRRLLSLQQTAYASHQRLRQLAAADSSCTDAQEAQETEEQFKLAVANSSSSTGNLQGSVMFLQDSKYIMVQASDSCKYQYLVAKNPSLLQPPGGSKARAAGDRAAPGSSRGPVRAAAATAAAEPAGWAWVAFSSVSALFGVVVCYMVVKLVARRNDLKRYDALQTSDAAATAAANGGTVQLVPTAALSGQQDQQQRSTGGGVKPSTAAEEESDTRMREDRNRLLKDNRRSDGGVSSAK